MAGTEVSSGEIKKRLNATQRAEVDSHLAAGRGVSLYADERGRPALIVSYGARGADLESRFPPSHYGRGELLYFTPARSEAKPMRSPLMDYEPPQQIARPRVSPTSTEYPSVALEMRTSGRPRGDGYINPERLLPGREEQPPPQVPQEPLSPDESWWASQVFGRG